MEKEKLIKASLIAGLKEFGRPHGTDLSRYKAIHKSAKRFSLKLAEYKLYACPTDELFWCWPRIIEGDLKDGACIGDFSYIFDPFTQEVLESGATNIDEKAFKEYSRKGKLYFYSADDYSIIGILRKEEKCYCHKKP